MTDRALLWIALLAAVVSLGPLFLVAWGASGGDGDPPRAVAGAAGLGVAIAAVASVVAVVRALAQGPSSWTLAAAAAPVVLAIVAVVAAGSTSWRSDPRSRLTADDVRAIGLDPAEHGFDDGARWRSGALAVVGVIAPLAVPILVLLTRQVP